MSILAEYVAKYRAMFHIRLTDYNSYRNEHTSLVNRTQGNLKGESTMAAILYLQIFS